MQCPTCGREVPELETGMCARCASERKPFMDLADHVDVVRCAHCGRMERRGTWHPAPSEAVMAAEQKVREETDVDPELDDASLSVEFSWEDDKNALARVRLAGAFKGHEVTRERETRVRMKGGACQDCSREFGGYFEAILQIRGSDARFEQEAGAGMAEEVARRLKAYKREQRTGAWASRSDRVRGGFDLYLGSLEIARLLGHDLADRHGAEYAESSKLVGRKDGRDLLRFTILVRFPPYQAGDFILFDDHLFKILRHEGRRLTLWDLRRAERAQREPKRARSLKIVGTAQDERDAVVVSRRGRDVQLLDPASLKTVDLRLPFDSEGATVRVFRFQEELIPLPDTYET